MSTPPVRSTARNDAGHLRKTLPNRRDPHPAMPSPRIPRPSSSSLFPEMRTVADATLTEKRPHSSTPLTGSRRFTAFGTDSSAASTVAVVDSPWTGSPKYHKVRPLSAGSFLSGTWQRDTDSALPVDGPFANKYALSSDPRQWSTFRGPEADDDMHNPKIRDRRSSCLSMRTFNVVVMLGIAAAIVTLFAGYPIIHTVTSHISISATGSANSVTNNVPTMPGRFQLIDPDTPKEALSRKSYMNPSETMKLVFSDEFNTEGRTFYPGDDPYWQAVDLHYWQTADLEWYDPAAIVTKDGALEITLSQKQTHGLNYQGGMLQSWNMMCFTGGIIETSVTLPGAPDVQGLWPALWSMGNLGRAGYGATTDGLWPYSYDSCDYGTVANQSIGDQPPGAFTPGGGDQFADDHLSFLPGQRLSRCTCPGESHPGPKDGKEFVGRAAPEIDIFEAQAAKTGLVGNVSQSVQIAPFNDGYFWNQGSGSYEIYDTAQTAFNPYRGGAYQQAISALTHSNQSCYELTNQCSATYALEYSPGKDVKNSYISWISNDKLSWTLTETALIADSNVQIGPRPISQEPMYLILNLGIAPGFEQPAANLQFPAKLRVDYIRVYQHPDKVDVTCDPKDFPTAKYITQYADAYSNPNFTSWEDAGHTFPKNSFLGQC